MIETQKGSEESKDYVIPVNFDDAEAAQISTIAQNSYSEIAEEVIEIK